jgi:hypothetical protein
MTARRRKRKGTGDKRVVSPVLLLRSEHATSVFRRVISDSVCPDNWHCPAGKGQEEIRGTKPCLALPSPAMPRHAPPSLATPSEVLHQGEHLVGESHGLPPQ